MLQRNLVRGTVFCMITYCEEQGPCFNPLPPLSTLLLKGKRKKRDRRRERGGKKKTLNARKSF